MQLSAIAILLSMFFFVICCLIPESPRYQAYCDMTFKHTYEFEKAVKLHNLWGEEDLQRKSIVDLFDELKKLNLLSLIGLFLVEQFIGGISILFYMKHFAQLSGESIDKGKRAASLTFKLFFRFPPLSFSFHYAFPPLSREGWKDVFYQFSHLSVDRRWTILTGTDCNGSGSDANLQHSHLEAHRIH